MSNGIDQLNKMRNKSTRSNGTRTMPPPRHQPRTTPVNLTADAPAQEQDDAFGTPLQEPANSVQPATAPAATEPVTPVEVPPVPAVPKAEMTAAPGGDVAQAQPKPDRPSEQVPTAGPSAEPEELTKSTIYLDEASDQFLEEAIYLGRKQKPRIDSRSAIVRYALRTLSESMTPMQVIDAIRAAAPPPGNQGRPRL